MTTAVVKVSNWNTELILAEGTQVNCIGWWKGLPYVIGTHSGGEEEIDWFTVGTK